MPNHASILLVGFLVGFKWLFGRFTYDVMGVLSIVEHVKQKVWSFPSGGRRDGGFREMF
jgi:hypothetical protein